MITTSIHYKIAVQTEDGRNGCLTPVQTLKQAKQQFADARNTSNPEYRDYWRTVPLFIQKVTTTIETVD